MNSKRSDKPRAEKPVYDIPLKPMRPKDDEDYDDLIFWVTGGKKAAEEKPAPPEKAFEAKLFEEYYKKQGFIPENKEEEFSASVRRPLPLSLRFHGLLSEATFLMQALHKEYFAKLSKVGPEQGVIKPPECVEWYPDQRAWRMEFDPKLINENKLLKEANRLIHEEVDAGFISLQEIASMIPVLLLDIRPEHKVLDMRAAPGDKSLQVLELLHSSSDLLEPTGFLLSSETHIKQCNKVLSRFSRSFSPNFALVNMDANALPEVFMPNADGVTESIFYDRVLCDLPCSGDGIFRKNIDGLRCWTPSSPLTHHSALIKMLHSGLGGLAIGGELVFCANTMNPIESEAVVHAVLTQQKDTVELVDVTDRMPNIVHSLGVEKWQVMTKGPRWFKSFAEVPEHYLSVVPDTAFPPEGEEQAKKFHLNRCIRIMPYDQDTAGVFIAVLRRTSSLYEAWIKEQEEINRAWEAAEAERIAREEEERKKREEEEEQKRKEMEEKRLEEEEKKKKEAEKKEAEAEKVATEEGKEEGDSEKKTEDTTESKEVKTEEGMEVEDKDKKDKKASEAKTDKKAEGKKETEKSKEESGDGRQNKFGREDRRDRKRDNNRNEREDRRNRQDSERGDWSQDKSEQNKQQAGETDRKQKREGSFANPFVFMAEKSPVWDAISSFYGISSEFPQTRLASQLLNGKPRIMYLVSESVKQLVLLNQELSPFLHVGVRMFSMYESAIQVECNYHIAQEGLPIMLPFLSDKRTVVVSKRDMLTLLSGHSAALDSLTVKSQQQLHKMESGGCIFMHVMETGGGRKKSSSQLAITGWKDDHMCRTFLSANQRNHYHRIAGGNAKEIEEEPVGSAVHTAMSQFAKHFSLMESAH